MLGGDENETKPVKKSARKGKADQDGRKAEPRKRKSTPRQAPPPEQVLEASEAISTPVTPAEYSLTDVLSDVSSGEVSPAAPVTAAEAVEAPNAPAEQLLEAAEAIGTAVMSNETVAIETSLAESSSVVPDAPAETVAVSYQTIADEYRRYTTESLDRTQTFFGRLAGVRSLDTAFELQSEFARQAYDGFVAESRKIRELHSQLARQRLQQWEGFVARMIGPR